MSDLVQKGVVFSECQAVWKGLFEGGQMSWISKEDWDIDRERLRGLLKVRKNENSKHKEVYGVFSKGFFKEVVGDQDTEVVRTIL